MLASGLADRYRQRLKPLHLSYRTIAYFHGHPAIFKRQPSHDGRPRLWHRPDDLDVHIAGTVTGMIEWAISNTPVPYPDAVAVMIARADAIRDKHAAELVWLLEHPPIYTAGTSANPEDLRDPNRLPVFETDRGGKYTYHGPGQRIAYLMLDLKRFDNDIRRLITNLEGWLIDTLARFNVKGEIRQDRVGLWVQRKTLTGERDYKIAAIGLRVRRGVTIHGISLNVEPDMDHYAGIVPCGINEHGLTSLVDLGLPVTMEEVDMALQATFEKRFGQLTRTDPPL